MWWTAMDLIRPRKLRVGDTIGVIAPSQSARYIHPQVWQRGMDMIRSLGVEVKVGRYVMERNGHSAGSVEQRLADLNGFLEDDEVNAIMTVYGGHSSHQLLEHIDYDMVRRYRKVFVGYSDITALNIAFLKKAGLINFSGPAFVTFCQSELPDYTTDHFLDIVCGRRERVTVRASDVWAEDRWFEKEGFGPREWQSNPGWEVLGSGKAEGFALGGNLGTMMLLSGTEFWPDLDGAILFLEEDESESPATIDRNLTHLGHLGAFDHISGLVLGRFPTSVGFDDDDDISSIVERVTKGRPMPIVTDVDISHTDPLFTIPLGQRAELDADKRSITFLERAVD
jgi:muramoyltetrapeptide carboxypeptidase